MLASPLLGLSVPTNATRSSGQNDDRPAKPSPVAVISSGCREQQAPDGEAVSPAADGERGQRRAEERRRAEEADLELRHAERQQIRRQHHGDEAVGEGAQRAGGEDEADHFAEP